MTDHDALNPYLFRPGAADGPNDLVAALIARRLREGRLGVRELRRLLGAPDGAGLSAAAQGRLRAQLAPARATCGAAFTDLERGFLLAQQHGQRQAEEETQRARFLAHLRSRLTFVGTDVPPETWSLLGWIEDDPDWPVALSRDGGLVILASGVPGSGKTLLSTLCGEGGLCAGEPLASARLLPTAHVFFHIEENDRLPQLLDALKPNPVACDLEVLVARLGVSGQALPRVRIAVPRSLLPELAPRLRPYEDLGLEVVPLQVRLGQLGQPGLEAALGAESGARYVQRMLEDAQDQGRDLSIGRMHRFVDEADDLNAASKRAAHARLRVLEEVAGPPDGPGIWDVFGPGVSTAVYLGGPHMGHGRTAPLLVGLLGGLLLPSEVHGAFHRFIVVDESNLLALDPVAWQAFVRTGRLLRHRGATLMIIGQDLECVPNELFGLASLCAVFRHANPELFEHTRQRIGALRGWRFEDVAHLDPGEVLLTATASTDPRWRPGTRRVRLRPPRCMHGGFTRRVV